MKERLFGILQISNHFPPLHLASSRAIMLNMLIINKSTKQKGGYSMPHDSERSAQIHRAIDLLIRSSQLHHRNIEKRFENPGLHRSQRRQRLHRQTA